MPIFKRDQEPPYNQATAARTPTPVVAQPAQRADKPANPAPTPAGNAGAPVPAAATGAGFDPNDTPPNRPPAAVIDAKTEITGALHSSGNVLIEGSFHGEVEAMETVWVERGAQSDGQLRASDAVISGSVDGEIDCRRRLQIAASAVVSGEIKTPILVIEDGATVNCRFSMAREGGLR